MELTVFSFKDGTSIVFDTGIYWCCVTRESLVDTLTQLKSSLGAIGIEDKTLVKECEIDFNWSDIKADTLDTSNPTAFLDSCMAYLDGSG